MLANDQVSLKKKKNVCGSTEKSEQITGQWDSLTTITQAHITLKVLENI